MGIDWLSLAITISVGGGLTFLTIKNKNIFKEIDKSFKSIKQSAEIIKNSINNRTEVNSRNKSYTYIKEQNNFSGLAEKTRESFKEEILKKMRAYKIKKIKNN